MNEAEERKQFEEWYLSTGGSATALYIENGTYGSRHVRLHFEGWRARAQMPLPREAIELAISVMELHVAQGEKIKHLDPEIPAGIEVEKRAITELRSPLGDGGKV